MAWLRSKAVNQAKALASGAGPGIEPRWLDYRKSAMDLHACPASSDRRDRSRLGASSVAESAHLNRRTQSSNDFCLSAISKLSSVAPIMMKN
jgi:hypothetical protein